MVFTYYPSNKLHSESLESELSSLLEYLINYEKLNQTLHSALNAHIYLEYLKRLVTQRMPIVWGCNDIAEMAS
jgi:hypothetical protein